MPSSVPTSPPDPPTRKAIHNAIAVITLLAVSAASIALTACAGSSDSSAAARAATAHAEQVFNHERAQLIELVHCARQRGVHLPEPNAQNKVSTRGVDMKNPRVKATVNHCFQKVLSTIKHEEKQVREVEGKPGEEAIRTPTASQPGTPTFERERAQLMEVVHCARRHGIHLPDPNTHTNNINTHGLHINSRHNKAIISACFTHVIANATKEQEEIAQEQQFGPKRLGEEPPSRPAN